MAEDKNVIIQRQKKKRWTFEESLQLCLICYGTIYKENDKAFNKVGVSHLIGSEMATDIEWINKIHRYL